MEDNKSSKSKKSKKSKNKNKQMFEIEHENSKKNR